MKVRVKYFATLKPKANPGGEEVQLARGATVDDLLGILDIAQDDVGVLIVSGKQATFDQVLKADDLVTLIPHIGGG